MAISRERHEYMPKSFDDRVCQYMFDCIVEGGVVDVYAENHEQDATAEASDYEEEMEDNLEDDEIEDEDLQPLTVWKSESKEVDKQVALVRQFYNSPNKRKEQANSIPGETNADEKSDAVDIS